MGTWEALNDKLRNAKDQEVALAPAEREEGHAAGGRLLSLGYDGKLYILACDHRGSFTKRFGIEGDPTPEDLERIADGKHLIFEGVEAALGRGADPSVTGVLVDEQYGGPAQVPEQAKAKGIKLAMPVEKSGQKESPRA